MEDWFLEVWREEEEKAGDRRPIEIIRYSNPEEAWAYVIENNIQYYCVYKAKCVVDAT